jgi:hypothetical protein
MGGFMRGGTQGNRAPRGRVAVTSCLFDYGAAGAEHRDDQARGYPDCEKISEVNWSAFLQLTLQQDDPRF